MADKREFLVVIDGKESVSPAAGKASDALGKMGDQAKRTERDFDGLDRKLQEHATTIGHLREEIAKTGDTKLFGELGKQQRDFDKLVNLRKKLTDEGEPAASGFFAKFFGKVGPLMASMPISGPMGIALGAAAIAAAPQIGATIAGAIVGGASLGGVVGGALIASKDARVKSAFADLSKGIGTDLRQAAAPFVPAMLDAVERVRKGFGPIGDDLKKIFAASSKFVAPLTDALLAGGKSISSGLSALVSGAGGPAIMAIADGVVGISDALGDMFRQLADNGPETAVALSDLFKVIEGGVRLVGFFVNGLTELYGTLRLIQAVWVGDTGAIARWVSAHGEAGTAVGNLTALLKDEGSAAYTTAQMVDLLTSALDEQVDDALSAAEANLRYKESLVAAKEAADHKKGASLEEERALINLIKATNETTRTNEESGVAADVAGKQFNGQREQLIKVATQMFGNKDAAKQYVDGLLKIPKSVATKILLNEAEAKRQVKNIQTAINGLHGKTIRNTIITGEFGNDDIGARHGMSTGGLVGGGGPPGKDTQVRVLASDEYVLTGKEVRQAGGPGGVKSALSGGGGGAQMVAQSSGRTQTLQLVIAPGRMSGLERMFLSWLKEAIANAGGNPAALAY